MSDRVSGPSTMLLLNALLHQRLVAFLLVLQKRLPERNIPFVHEDGEYKRNYANNTKGVVLDSDDAND